MAHNRKKLIDLFVGNMSNAILHRILEKAVEDEVIRKYYDKEFLNSLEIAKNYREKINPVHSALKEASQIKEVIIKKVTNELKIRISKGYKNIDLNLVEPTASNTLSELKVT
ncbi:hypothetical protein HYX08_01260 [Candidatus Woesearchaeota archaeon]|nr:hypothetical protein [Candidatus Woesearchaeota archaeon]